MKNQITIVSLGPGDPSLLTLAAADTLRSAKHLILRTGRHGVAEWLTAQAVTFDTLDALYDAYEDFDDLHRAMARTLWQRASETPLVYAVMDATTDGSVAALAAAAPEDAVILRISGVTCTDVCLHALPGYILAASSVRTLPAMDAPAAAHDPATPLMITELDARPLAGDVKLWLTDLYDDEMEVVFFPPCEKAARKVMRIQLSDLDRQKKYDHTCAVYIPAAPFQSRKRYCLRDLEDIVAILRGPGGCPWDRQQTHESLRKDLLEEAYEACGAIDEQDPDHLYDELGDVLLHIALHANIAAAHGEFNMTDIISAICNKMIYRHEHIFGKASLSSVDAVLDNWDKLKQAEKGLTSQASVLSDISRALPALVRAAKVQKKAAKVGFDWDNAIEALPKIHEEAEEVLAELKKDSDPGEELGDLLFSCVNVARLCGQDPEALLTAATEKFIRRFTQMENLIISDGKALGHLTLAEMDVYWNRVKVFENHA